MSQSNNGLMTKIWGPCTWFTISCFAFGYPTNPTPEQKQQYRIFFEYLGFVLPCIFCRDSYQCFIKDDDTILDDYVMENRETLTHWVFRLHNRVNHKLSADYGTTYEEFYNKYESFRAKCAVDISGCSMPLELKSIAFKNADEKQCRIVPLEIIAKFKLYAKKRGISFDKIKYYDNLVQNNRNSEEYHQRNIMCREQIKKIQYGAIHSLEQEGEYKGLPSIEELKLMSLLCTNLAITNLEAITNKMPDEFKIKKIYRLVK